MTDDKRFTCEVTDTDLCHIETITDNFEMNTFDDVETVTELLNKFSEENKELKQAIKEVLKLLEEEVDLFSDKATEHDIQAYIELRELDNKDAYYMAVSTKKAIKILKEMIE